MSTTRPTIRPPPDPNMGDPPGRSSSAAEDAGGGVVPCPTCGHDVPSSNYALHVAAGCGGGGGSFAGPVAAARMRMRPRTSSSSRASDGAVGDATTSSSAAAAASSSSLSPAAAASSSAATASSSLSSRGDAADDERKVAASTSSFSGLRRRRSTRRSRRWTERLSPTTNRIPSTLSPPSLRRRNDGGSSSSSGGENISGSSWSVGAAALERAGGSITGGWSDRTTENGADDGHAPDEDGDGEGREVIDLDIDDVDDVDDGEDGIEAAGAYVDLASPQQTIAIDDDDDDDANANNGTDNNGSQWPCPRCTLLNPRSSSSCDACQYYRPTGGVPPSTTSAANNATTTFSFSSSSSSLPATMQWRFNRARPTPPAYAADEDEALWRALERSSEAQGVSSPRQPTATDRRPTTRLEPLGRTRGATSWGRDVSMSSRGGGGGSNEDDDDGGRNDGENDGDCNDDDDDILEIDGVDDDNEFTQPQQTSHQRRRSDRIRPRDERRPRNAGPDATYVGGGALLGSVLGAANAYARGNSVADAAFGGAVSGAVGGALVGEVLRDLRRQQGSAHAQPASSAVRSAQQQQQQQPVRQGSGGGNRASVAGATGGAWDAPTTTNAAAAELERWGRSDDGGDRAAARAAAARMPRRPPAPPPPVMGGADVGDGFDALLRSMLLQTVRVPRGRGGVMWHQHHRGGFRGGGGGYGMDVDGMSYDQLLQVFGDGSENRGADAARITALPDSTVTDPEKELPEDKRQCMVCLEDFEKGDRRRMLPCLHGFHVACIDRWLGTNASCPVCKHAI